MIAEQERALRWTHLPWLDARIRAVSLHILLFTLFLVERESSNVPAGLTFLPTALFFAVGFSRQWSHLLRGNRTAFSAFFGLSGLLVVTRIVAARPEMVLGVALQSTTAVLLGWSLILWAYLPGVNDIFVAKWTRPSRLILLAFVPLLGIALAHLLTRGSYAFVVDEVLYLLQSELFGQPGYTLPMATEDHPFFAIRYTILSDGQFYTQYPPGWPALLAAFEAVALRWWIGPVLGAFTCIVTYWIGRRLHSSFVGIIAAAFLATNYYFLAVASTYFAHAASAAFVVSGAALLLAAENTQSRRVQAVIGTVAGAVLGAVVLIRPLTGLVMGVALWLWIIVRGYLTKEQVLRLTMALVLGSIAPAAAFLHFNAETTGDPLTLGYSEANGPITGFGFGERGFVVYDDVGMPVERTITYLPINALGNMADNLWMVLANCPLIFVVLPILFIAYVTGFRFSWIRFAPFVLLPVAHFFYFSPSFRFYTVLLPFVFLGLSAICAYLYRSHRASTVILVGVIAVECLLTAPLALWGQRDAHRLFQPYFEKVEEAHASHGPVLIFVKDPPEIEPLFEALYWYNAQDFYGEVIVARDLGTRNVELIERYPSHTPLRARWRAATADSLLLPLETVGL